MNTTTIEKSFPSPQKVCYRLILPRQTPCLPPASGQPWPAFYHNSVDFSRASHEWNNMVFYPFVAGFLGLGVLSMIFLRLNHTVAWINTSFIRDWFPMAGLQTQQPPGEEHTLLCRLLKLYLPWSVCKGGEALGHIRLNPPQRAASTRTYPRSQAAARSSSGHQWQEVMENGFSLF